MPFYLKQTAAGEIALKELPKLVPGPNELLIKVSHVAQNPTDWQQNELAVHVDSTVGYEFAGVVESTPSSKFSVGDRVAGFTFGNCSFNGEYGSYGEYCLAFPHVTFKIPEHMSSEEAAGLPTALMVAGQALGQVLGYSWKDGERKESEPLLIWGGGTAMGAIAIQLAKAAGASPIITTAGPGRETYVKSLGADIVLDYNDELIVSKIRAAAGEGLSKGFDCASTNGSMKLTSDCLGPSGGDVAVLNVPGGDERKDVKMAMTLTMTALGADFEIFGMSFPKNDGDTAYMTSFWENVVQPFVDAGKLKAHTTLVLPGGLNGVRDGWELMKKKRSNGKKLVYAIADTKIE